LDETIEAVKRFAHADAARFARRARLLGAEEGLDVDTLYNLNFPDLVFNIHNELTGNVNNAMFTYREHHGLMAPTDESFESFINEYILKGWGSFESMPDEIKRIILNSHMSKNAIYLSDLNDGFLNGSEDSIILDQGSIIQRTYGSNCTFLGLNKTIIPRAFKSICRPMYLNRDFQIMLYAVEDTKILNAMKRPNVNYAFYLPRDAGIGYAGDSSLVRLLDNPKTKKYQVLKTGPTSLTIPKAS